MARIVAEFIPSGVTSQPIVTYTRITGLDFSMNNYVLKITGEAAGAGGTTDDIIVVMGEVSWRAAA